MVDRVDYDFYEGAIDVTGIINSCSPDAVYTTVGATPDRNARSNWDNNGPKFNRWFMFTAPTADQINITVEIVGTKGDQWRKQIALWEADGSTEVSSTRYQSYYDDVILRVPSLTAGNTYYISIDYYNNNTDGSFSLCLNTASATGEIILMKYYLINQEVLQLPTMMNLLSFLIP